MAKKIIADTTASGTLDVTGDISTSGVISSNFSSGDEGGQLNLKKSATNTTLNTGVSLDINQNKLRIFETGGTNRGFYLDIATGGASVGTNLGGGTIGASRLPSGSIIQTLSATSITQSTTTSATYTNIPNLSVTITPTSSSSKFLLMAHVNNSTGSTTGGWVYFAFARAGSALGLNTGAGTFNAYAIEYHKDNTNMASTSLFYVDSPATTSSVTYTVQWATYSGQTGYLNRRAIDTAFTGRSYFTVLEIA